LFAAGRDGGSYELVGVFGVAGSSLEFGNARQQLVDPR
jgi:hypothetical protein